MKVASFSAAIVALMVTQTECFQVSCFNAQSSSALRMSSNAYEEQLRSYYGEDYMKKTNVGSSAPTNKQDPPQTNGVPYPPNSAVQNGAPTVTSSSTSSYMNGQQQAPPQQVPPPQSNMPVLSNQSQAYAQPQQAQAPPVPVSPPPPVPVQQNAVAPAATEKVIEVTENSGGIPPAGIAFLGLPLWLLLSVQVFGGSLNVAPPPAPIVPAPIVQQAPMTFPATMATSGAPSAANTAGVVVLSQPITKAEVRNLFNLWNDALQTGDPSIVAKRYSKDGVLLPTLSDRPRTDFEGIRDYFVHFLEKKPVGKILEGEIFIGNNWAQDAGKNRL